MTNWNQKGDTITVAAPATVVGGAGVLIGRLFGVAAFSAASGAQLEIQTVGVVSLAKDTSTFTDGARVFWNNGTGQATSIQGSNREIGVACLLNPDGSSDPGGLSADATVRLRLNYEPGLAGGGIFLAHFLYSFAVDGGAVGAIVPSISDTLPANAVVLGGAVNSSTAVTSAGAATVAIGTTAGSSATSILAATGKASFTLDAVLEDADVAAPFKLSAAGQIQLTVGTAALTAGVIEGWVMYVLATFA